MSDSEKGQDPLSFEAMHIDRQTWDTLQLDEYRSMLLGGGTPLANASIVTRARLEGLLLALVRKAEPDLGKPALSNALRKASEPGLKELIKLAKAYGLIDTGAWRACEMIREIGNRFAHDCLTSSLESSVSSYFQKLRETLDMPANTGPIDDVELLSAAMGRCICGVRDWTRRPSMKGSI